MSLTPEAIVSRLQANARARGLVTEHLISRWVSEAYLARMSGSPVDHHCVLKGGFLFTLWEGDLLRSTKDADLHMAIEDMPICQDILMVIAGSTTFAPDGVTFQLNTVKFLSLKGGRNPGLRMSMDTRIGKTFSRLCIDVGFDHPIRPGIERRYYPRLFREFASFPVWSYPRETVIAEKLATAVEFGASNTRLRDYYDLWFLSEKYCFLGHTLVDAIEHTFSMRDAGKHLRQNPVYWMRAFSPDFATPSNRRAWKVWLDEHAPTADAPELRDVLLKVAAYSIPILEAVRERRPLKMRWNPRKGWLPNGLSPKAPIVPELVHAASPHLI
jgi:hypothetical protein